MNINVEVVKNGKENTSGLLRRFTKRVQGSGIVRRVRGIRYNEREMSSYTKKKSTLKRIGKVAKMEKLKKLGRI